MTQEDFNFLNENAVVTDTEGGLSVRLHTPLFAGWPDDTKRHYDQNMICEWLKIKGYKDCAPLNRANYRNTEEANRDKTWNFSLEKKKKSDKMSKPKTANKPGKKPLKVPTRSGGKQIKKEG